MGCTASSATFSSTTRMYSERRRPMTRWVTQAQKLHKAIESTKTDEAAILEVVVSLKNKERQRVLKVYQDEYKEDLKTVLKSELSGGMREGVLALLNTPEYNDAHAIHGAVDTQDYDTLTEIVATRRSELLESIRETYEETFNISLKDDLQQIKDTDLRNLLTSLYTVVRPLARVRADINASQERAQQLLKDDDLVSLIIEPLSRNQLRATLDEFKDMSGQPNVNLDLEQYIEEKCDLSLPAKRAIQCVVSCVYSPAKFFAKELKKTLQKDVDRSKLLRIVVSRSEIDLYNIKKEYFTLYQKQLMKDLEKKCKNGYLKSLRVILETRGQYRASVVIM